MNVTLIGNYTKSEGPYKAKLKSYYADSDEPKTRDIEANVSKKLILNQPYSFSSNYSEIISGKTK